MTIMKDFAVGEKYDCANLPPKAPTIEAEWKSLLNHAIQHCAENRENINVAMSQTAIDRNYGKAMANFMESDRAPMIEARFKEHIESGSLPANTDTQALAQGFALTMLGIGYLGQNVMKLDPKQLERIINSLAKPFADAAASKRK